MRKYIKIHRSFFIGALLSTFISSLFAVVLQFFKGDVLDYAVAGQLENTARYAVLLIVFILFEVFFYFCYCLLLARFSAGCTGQLKQDIFRSILERSYISYTKQTQGAYIAKYTTQADTIKNRYFDMWPSFFEILFKTAFVSIALFWLDWRIAVITLGLLTTPLYLPKLIEGRLQRAQADYLEENAEHLAKVNDWLSGFEIIKNFSVESRIMDRFRESNCKTMDKLLQDTQLGAAAQLISTLISYVSYFIVLACSTWLVLRGDFSAGDFFVAIGMIDQLSYPLISLSQIIRLLVAVKPTCRDMEQFLSASEKAEAADSIAFEKAITFDHVTFSYEDAPAILNDMSLRIHRGGRYLFCGPSGCGKTTAINLLLRYYDVDSGEIRLDGKSLVNYDNTYGCMTVLRQDAILFHDTLRNNLTMYREVEDGVLIALLLRLGLDQYASKASLDGVISENGGNLSGGERKRICLGRALLRNTDILILDEPLANLDEDTAQRIEELILSIEDKTLIVVSHQFSKDNLHRFDKVVDFASYKNHLVEGTTARTPIA